MKKLFLLAVVVILAGVGLVYYSNSEAEKYESQIADEKENQVLLAKKADLIDRISKTNNRESLLALESELNSFDKSFKESVSPHLNLRIAAVTLADADDKFERARALQISLVIPQEPPAPAIADIPSLPDPQNSNRTTPPKIHPSVQAIVNQAIPLYEDAKKRIDKVQDQKGDSNFNYSLHYLKGEIYHRHLQILATEETQQELFRQTMNEYKLALRERPGDNDTSINIEILIKGGQGGGNDDPNGRRNKILNQAVGFGRTKGN